ncbi:GNAT family N-acetyltransferase [Candidatus Pacearchaeota archaeon]|nr:GNAT family N-acetyltransferase [Candidatus Pacearchaeota archaeon]
MIKIRKAVIKDISKLLAIGRQIKEFKIDSKRPGFWSKKQLERWIKSKSDVILIAEENKNIIGFVFFAHHVPTGKVIFENAWIHPKYRGTGIINILTKEGVKQLKSKKANDLCSFVEIKNVRSRLFLEKNKFKRGLSFIWMYKEI